MKCYACSKLQHNFRSYIYAIHVLVFSRYSPTLCSWSPADKGLNVFNGRCPAHIFRLIRLDKPLKKGLSYTKVIYFLSLLMSFDYIFACIFRRVFTNWSTTLYSQISVDSHQWVSEPPFNQKILVRQHLFIQWNLRKKTTEVERKVGTWCARNWPLLIV